MVVRVLHVQYKEVEVQLSNTTVLGTSGKIQLKVLVENSEVAATSTHTTHPTLTTSRIKNVVVIRSGETVLLGGLVVRHHQHDQQGIPGFLEYH